MPMVNTRGNLTSHNKILDRVLNAITWSKEDQDNMTTTYNLDPIFELQISITSLKWPEDGNYGKRMEVSKASSIGNPIGKLMAPPVRGSLLVFLDIRKLIKKTLM